MGILQTKLVLDRVLVQKQGIEIWSWRALNNAAEADMCQCVCGKPFPIWNEVSDPRKLSVC